MKKLVRNLITGLIFLVAIFLFISALYDAKDVKVNNFSSGPFITTGIAIFLALIGWGVYESNLSPEEKRKREKRRAEARARNEQQRREEERRKRIEEQAYYEEIGRQKARDRIKYVKQREREDREIMEGVMDYFSGRPPKSRGRKRR